MLPGFSLVEAVTAVIILALVSSSVLVVINRCMASSVDMTLRMQAFEVARENMEQLLAKDSAELTVDYGTSDKYPEIQWQTTVETFMDSATSRMWVKAVCSTEYTDSKSEDQKIELTHWLTSVSKEEMKKILKWKKQAKDLLDQGEGSEDRLGEQDESGETDEGTDSRETSPETEEQPPPEDNPEITRESLEQRGISPELIDVILQLLNSE